LAVEVYRALWTVEGHPQDLDTARQWLQAGLVEDVAGRCGKSAEGPPTLPPLYVSGLSVMIWLELDAFGDGAVGAGGGRLRRGQVVGRAGWGDAPIGEVFGLPRRRSGPSPRTALGGDAVGW